MSKEIIPQVAQTGELNASDLYDAERHNIHGQEVLIHQTSESMATALDQEQPDSRVFTFIVPSLLSASQRVAFIDAQRRVHGFEAQLTTDEQAKAAEDLIRGAIERNDHREADGAIKVDHENGHVYQVYKTDRPEQPEAVQAQVQAWAEDVRAASAADPEDGLIQHITEGDATIADYTQGRNHLITVLHNEEGYTLDSVAEDIEGVLMQDNGPVLRWAEVVRS